VLLACQWTGIFFYALEQGRGIEVARTIDLPPLSGSSTMIVWTNPGHSLGWFKELNG